MMSISSITECSGTAGNIHVHNACKSGHVGNGGNGGNAGNNGNAVVM